MSGRNIHKKYMGYVLALKNNAPLSTQRGFNGRIPSSPKNSGELDKLLRKARELNIEVTPSMKRDVEFLKRVIKVAEEHQRKKISNIPKKAIQVKSKSELDRLLEEAKKLNVEVNDEMRNDLKFFRHVIEVAKEIRAKEQKKVVKNVPKKSVKADDLSPSVKRAITLLERRGFKVIR